MYNVVFLWKYLIDVPIEVITINSSEAGAKSEFSNLYSRNIEINDVESNNKKNL